MREPIDVDVRIMPEGEGLPMPSYMTDGAAGCDLVAAVTADVIVAPGERTLVSAGFSMRLPPGYEAQIRPRSGLALRHGITCLNAPGTIDSDYRGPVCVLLVNLSLASYTIKRGDRIAQLIVAAVERARFHAVEALDETTRASGGFGSTGLDAVQP